MARRPINTEQLAERIRGLLAAAPGLPENWLRETAGQVTDLLLEVEAWRTNSSQTHSARVRRDLAIVEAHAALAQSMGAQDRVALLRDRFGVSRATIFRALRVQSHQRETAGG